MAFYTKEQILEAKEIQGRVNEENCISVLSEHFGKTLTKRSGYYDSIDFHGENVEIELKSRLYSFSNFNTWIIGFSKIQNVRKSKSNNPNLKAYFCYLFTDGLYFFEYTEDLFENNGAMSAVSEMVNKQTGQKSKVLHVKSQFFQKINDFNLYEHPILVAVKEMELSKYKKKQEVGKCLLKIQPKK